MLMAHPDAGEIDAVRCAALLPVFEADDRRRDGDVALPLPRRRVVI
jgi:hypothetical protein